MTDKSLLVCPAKLKSVQHFLKLAADYDVREPIISYWARLHALQTAMKLDRSSPEARNLLVNLMDWLEKFKKSHADNEALTSDVAGQALLENEANRLFVWADSNDRSAVFNKNVVKSFYSTGVLLDVCEVFGELSEEVSAQRKYAKWKATYIHNCLKNGETPIPGPIGEENDEFNLELPQPPQPPTFSPPNPSMPSVDASSPAHHPAVPQHPPAGPPPPQPAYPSPPAATPSASFPSGAPGAPVSSGVPPSDIKQARKYCRWAESALDYDDISTAVENLTKALGLLTGR